MSELLKAVALFRHHKRLRRFVWKPVAWGAAGFLGGVLAIAYSASFLVGRLAGDNPSAATLGGLGGLLAGALMLFVAGPILASLISLASAFHWDALAKEIAQIEGLDRRPQPLSGGAMAFEIPLRIGFSVFLLVVAIVLTLFGLWWLAALITGLMGFADFTAPICQRQGRKFPKSLFTAFRQKGALPLWGAASLCSVLPLLYAVALPIFAAAGCLVAGEREGQGGRIQS
jgi:hypothetical protein